MKRRVVLSILAACIMLSSGCSKQTEPAGELNTKSEVTLDAEESTHPSVSEESAPEKATQETEDISGEQITVPEEPTAPSDEVVTEPVTEPDAEVVIPTQKETTGPKDTESVTTEPTQSVTQKPTQPVTAAPTQPATQKPTEAVTQAPTKPATQKPTEAPTQKPTEVQTTAPDPKEEATEAPTREKTAWDYPWDLDAIEAELRAYGESLGMTYYDEEYVRNDYLNNPQVQQWWTLEEWMQDGILTPDNASWMQPHYLDFDDSIYVVDVVHDNCYARLERLTEVSDEGFRIYFEVDETGKHCTIYTLY